MATTTNTRPRADRGSASGFRTASEAPATVAESLPSVAAAGAAFDLTGKIPVIPGREVLDVAHDLKPMPACLIVAGARPIGLTEIGWRASPLDSKQHHILQEAAERMEGAGLALREICARSPAHVLKPVMMIASALMDQAHLIRAVQQAQYDLGGQEEEAQDRLDAAKCARKAVRS